LTPKTDFRVEILGLKTSKQHKEIMTPEIMTPNELWTKLIRGHQ